MNESCVDHLAFRTAANNKSQVEHAIGLKMAVGAVNEYLRQRYSAGATVLNTGEVDSIRVHMTQIVKDYEVVRSKALGNGLKWDDDDSVKAVVDIVKAMPGVGAMEVGVHKAFIDEIDKFARPWRQFVATGQHYAAYLQAESLQDAYGDLHLLSHMIGGVSSAVDPALALHLGITTQMKGTEIVENDALVASVFLSKDNQTLLKKIAAGLKGGQTMTREKLNAIQQELARQQRAKTIVDNEARVTEEKMRQVQDFEASVKIFSSMAHFIEDPQMRKFISNTAVVGSAAATIYRSALNPEKLGKLVLTANVVDAVGAVFSLFFGSGGNELEALSQQVADLQKSVQNLHESLFKGFELTYERLDTIYHTITAGFGEVLQGQALQLAQMDKLNDAIADMDRQLGRVEDSLDSYLAALAERLKTTLNARLLYGGRWFKNEELSESEFRTSLASLLSEATLFPSDPIATSLSLADLRTLRQAPTELRKDEYRGLHNYTMTGADTELRGKDPLSAMNYLAAFSYANLEVNTFPDANGQLVPIPGYPQWLLATSTIVEVMRNHRHFGASIGDSAYDDMAATGERIREFITNLRGKKWLAAALRKVESHQALLCDELEKLQNEYLGTPLREYQSTFWGEPPKSTSTYVPRFPAKIPKEALGLTKDLDIIVPSNPLPDHARVALLLGVGDLNTAWNLVGEKSPKGNIWAGPVRDGQTISLNSMGGSNRTEIVRVKLDADLNLRTTFAIGQFEVANWSNFNYAPLWIGSRQYFKQPGSIRERERNEASAVNVLEQLWADGNYQLRDRIKVEPFPPANKELLSAIEKKWRDKQGELRNLFLMALTGQASATLTESVKSCSRRAVELDASYRILQAAMPIAFAPSLRESNALVEVLWGRSGTFDLDEFREFIAKRTAYQGNPLLVQARAEMASRHQHLSQVLNAEQESLDGVSETLVELDSMLATVRALRSRH